MNRKKSLSLMKIACGITFLLGIVLFWFIAPKVLIHELPYFFKRAWNTQWALELAYVEVVGALCFLSLSQVWNICNEIGRDNSFSRKNVKSLKHISLYMAIACAMMAVGLISCLIYRNSAVLTGLSALGTCIALIFALFARAMAQLIEAGAALKDENDLTI